MIGNVNLTRFGGTAAALVYWLVSAARGRGLASDAAATLASWGFGTLGLTRIRWWDMAIYALHPPPDLDATGATFPPDRC